MLKCILIKPKEKQVEEVQFLGFHEILGAINARVIDIVSRKIGIHDRVYKIYVDYEGLLKDDPHVSAWVGAILVSKTDSYYGEMVDMSEDDIEYISNLVGDILVSKTDSYGEMIDLSEDDIEHFKNHCGMMINIVNIDVAKK